MDAELITDSVSAVDPERRAVRLASGGAVQYDVLVLAIGARHRTAFTRAMTFTGDASTLTFNGLLADLEQGWSHSVAFVVPPGTTWLPLYELALMTARSVHGMGIDDAGLQVISPEATPLALFGEQASRAVSELLDLTGRGAEYLEHRLHDGPGGESAPELRLWSASHKVDGRYLSPWLAELDGEEPQPAVSEADHLEIEVQLPSAHELGQEAIGLDPYSPPRPD